MKESDNIAAVLPPLDMDLVASREYRIATYANHHKRYTTIHSYLRGTTMGSELLASVWRDTIEIRGWFTDQLIEEDTDRLGNYNKSSGIKTERLLAPFLGHSCVFVATVGHRGCLGAQRTVVLNDVRLHGGKMVLAGHVWMKWDERWSAIEPLFGGTKVVVVGKVKEYTRTDSTRDLTIKAKKVFKLNP